MLKLFLRILRKRLKEEKSSHSAKKIEEQLNFLKFFYETKSGLVILKEDKKTAELIFEMLPKKNRQDFQLALEESFLRANSNLKTYNEKDALTWAEESQQEIFIHYSALLTGP